MTLDQLRKFADSRETHIRQIALTREAARAIIAEHDAEVAKNQAPGFEIIERGTGGYAAMERARIERLAADDARGVW